MKKLLEKLNRGEHVTLVALGDSNTAETFHTRGHMSWTSLLAEALFEAYGSGVCTMINSGICGQGFDGALARLERDVSRFKPDLVIIAFGVLGAMNGLEKLDAFKNSLRELIRAIQETCGCEILLRTPNPLVAVHGIPLPDGQQGGRPWKTKPFREYAEAQVAVANELGCSVVDHFKLWNEAEFPFKHAVANPQGLWP